MYSVLLIVTIIITIIIIIYYYILRAAENGSDPIVRLLLDHKAEVNVMSEGGFSPLIIACAHGHLKVVQMLLAAGADMNLPHPVLSLCS